MPWGGTKDLGTLTGFGKWIDKLLDTLDPNHSLNSIDYYIEPTDQIIDKLAWIHIEDGRILVTRTTGRKKYYIPGGKREAGESDAQALIREIKEELSVALELASPFLYWNLRSAGRWIQTRGFGTYDLLLRILHGRIGAGQ